MDNKTRKSKICVQRNHLRTERPGAGVPEKEREKNKPDPKEEKN